MLWATWSSWRCPCSLRGTGLDDLERSLPTQSILWFYYMRSHGSIPNLKKINTAHTMSPNTLTIPKHIKTSNNVGQYITKIHFLNRSVFSSPGFLAAKKNYYQSYVSIAFSSFSYKLSLAPNLLQEPTSKLQASIAYFKNFNISYFLPLTCILITILK